MQFVISDPQLDKDGHAIVWVQATPTFCLDYIECIATDEADHSEMNTSRLITDVTGTQYLNAMIGSTFQALPVLNM